MLAELGKPPKVIFTTAYDEFAIKAFQVNAVDYLLKPIDPNLLTAALVKVKEEILKEKAETLNQYTRIILKEDDQIFIKDNERCWFIKLQEIRLFESVGNYTKVHFGNNKPLILKSLSALEQRLNERQFFRANRRHIINLKWIEKIEPYFNSSLSVELKGGDKIEISRRQTVKFKEMMSF
jgi:two-component system LytT family response regulator